jgi:hypothetical protein
MPRTYVYTVRVTREERDLWSRLAKAQGLNTASLIRFLIATAAAKSAVASPLVEHGAAPDSPHFGPSEALPEVPKPPRTAFRLAPDCEAPMKCRRLQAACCNACRRVNL